MKINESMTKTVVFFEPEEDLESAYFVMKHLGCGYLPVSQGGYLAGIISDRDILLRSKLEGEKVVVPRLSIEDVMNIKVITIYEDESVGAAAKKMLNHKIDCLVVTKRDGTLTGIITSSDLLHLLADEENHQHKLPYNFDLKAYNQAMFLA